MKAFLTLFGIGKSRFPGTLSSFIALLLFLLIQFLARDLGRAISLTVLLLFLLFSLIAIKKERKYLLIDRKEIVADEFLAMYLCLFIVNSQSVLVNISLFVLFRFFDIFKIPPVSTVNNKMKNGYGVFLDDLLIALGLSIIFCLLLLL